MSLPDVFAAIDFETADPGRDSACAVGLCRVEGSSIVYTEASLIRPPREKVHPMCQAVHGLTWLDLRSAKPFAEVWRAMSPILAGVSTLVAHNVQFDRSVLVACCEAADLSVPDCDWICTLEMSRARWPKPFTNKLPDVCQRLGITFRNHHNAKADAIACAKVLLALEGRLPVAPVPEAAPADEEPALEFVPVGLAGEILCEIPVSQRTPAVARLMQDAQYLGPRHAEMLVELLRERAAEQKVGWFVCPKCGGARSWLTDLCLRCMGVVA